MNVSRDLVLYTISLICGIICGYYTLLVYQISLVIFLVLLSILLVSRLLAATTYQRIVLVLLFFFLGLGNIDYQETAAYSLEQWTGQEIKVSGTVKSPRANYVILRVESVNKTGIAATPSLLIYLNKGDSQVYRWGDYVSFKGFLDKPLPATNPGGFSPQKYWREKGIEYQLNPLAAGQIERSARGLPVVANKLRDNIYRIIKENLPEREAGILLGILLGDKEQIDKEFYEAAQKLGIAHVFAVSGLHVGLVLAFFLALSKILKLPDLIILLGSLFLLTGYSLLTGLTPSVVRAAIMALLGLVAVKNLKYKDFYTILAAAAFLILLINPLSLFSISFQLSFITTLGIVYLLPLIKNLLFFVPEKTRPVLAVPLAAQLAALPLTVYYFNTLSLLAPFYNLLIVPLVSLLIPLLFTALVLSLIFSGLAQPFILLAGGLTYGISSLIVFLDQAIAGYFYLGRPALILILSYYLLLTGLKEADKIRAAVPLKLRYLPAAALLVVLIILVRPGAASLEIAFLDVGQGDGAVIKTPNNKYVVIDGGPGEDTVANYLKYQGVNSVALAVLSHPDHDHINGLYKVVNDFRTEILLVPPDVAKSLDLSELKELAILKGTRVIEGKPGMALKLPCGIDLKVLAPDLNKIELLDTNNASLVINCIYGEQDFLFTGDIDQDVLKQLLPKLEDIEVIKIPHHGSKNSYSEQFYTGLKPDFAVISAGRGNRYGHPHSIVTGGLQKEGIRVYRTDLQGAVIVKTDGRSLEWDTMLKNSY